MIVSLLFAGVRFGRRSNSLLSRSIVSSWLTHVKTLSPTALDFEIRNMSLGEGLMEFRAMLRAIAWILEAGRDFEVPETILNHFLKVGFLSFDISLWNEANNFVLIFGFDF